MSNEALGDGPHEMPAIVAVKATAKTKAKSKAPKVIPAIPAGTICCLSTADLVIALPCQRCKEIQRSSNTSILMVERTLALRGSGLLGGERRWHRCM